MLAAAPGLRAGSGPQVCSAHRRCSCESAPAREVDAQLMYNILLGHYGDFLNEPTEQTRRPLGKGHFVHLIIENLLCRSPYQASSRDTVILTLWAQSIDVHPCTSFPTFPCRSLSILFS